jgi:hypothetical protein
MHPICSTHITPGSECLQVKFVLVQGNSALLPIEKLQLPGQTLDGLFFFGRAFFGLRALPTTSATTRDDARSKWP